MKADLADALSRLPAQRYANETVLIRPIRTEDDLAYAIFRCELTEEQRALVNPAGFSIGRAYLAPADNVPCLICTLDGRPVGFIHFLRWLGQGSALSWSFYVDSREQGKGYGRAAARLAIRLLRTACPGEPIKLSTEATNTRAQALYLSLGFRRLDELDGDDLVFGL